MICHDLCSTFYKQDNRGKHWKAKAARNNAPTPWVHTKEWADKRCRKEAELARLIVAHNIIYTLPWRRITPCARVIGNTNKVLFMELLSHHINQIAKLGFVDENAGFLGIASVHVAAESRPAFDAGLVPSVEGKRRSGSNAQIKTLVKIWSTAGFIERVLEDGSLSFTFDRATFGRMRAQAQRADDRRRACKPDADARGHHGALPPSPENSQLSQIAAQTDLAQSAQSVVTGTTSLPTKDILQGLPFLVRSATARQALKQSLPRQAPTANSPAANPHSIVSMGMSALIQAAEESRDARPSPAAVAAAGEGPGSSWPCLSPTPGLPAFSASSAPAAGLGGRQTPDCASSSHQTVEQRPRPSPRLAAPTADSPAVQPFARARAEGVAEPRGGHGTSTAIHSGLSPAACIGVGRRESGGDRARADSEDTPESGGGARKVARCSVECRDALTAAAAAAAAATATTAVAASVLGDPDEASATGDSKTGSGLGSARLQAAEEVARAARLIWEASEASASFAAAAAMLAAAEAQRASAELREVMAKERMAAVMGQSLAGGAVAGPGHCPATLRVQDAG